ncbi:MAG: helix-turn-helix transcriptional regulator, partial [Acetobacteraceae bacterium]
SSDLIAQPDGTRFAGHLMPLAGSLRDGADRQRRARTALFIQPVGELQPLPGEVLVKLYGLTPAETRLLALLGQDLSLDETAATLGITMPTARTHLQRIFQKTNTNRQSQLVRLVLSALPRPPS